LSFCIIRATDGPSGTVRSRLLSTRRLLLIRLFQLTRGGNMSGCLAQLFQKPYGSFNRGLPPKKPVSNTSPNAAGRMASCVRDVENAERIS